MDFYGKLIRDTLSGKIANGEVVVNGDYAWKTDVNPMPFVIRQRLEGVSKVRTDEIERTDFCQFAEIPPRQRTVLVQPKQVIECCDPCGTRKDVAREVPTSN